MPWALRETTPLDVTYRRGPPLLCVGGVSTAEGLLERAQPEGRLSVAMEFRWL
jgi:hypothetical protein